MDLCSMSDTLMQMLSECIHLKYIYLISQEYKMLWLAESVIKLQNIQLEVFNF